MRFFDAHCDTIGIILEAEADFLAEPGSGGAGAAASGAKRAPIPHVTLPGLKAGGIGAQVFASWVWSGKYKGCEFESAMNKVEAVRALCAAHPADLTLAATGADLATPFAPPGGPGGGSVGGEISRGGEAGGGASAPPAGGGRIAVLPSLESADALEGDIDNLFGFYEMGVRLLTLAWGDNAFCGSTYGDRSGLTKKGADLVAACESLGVMVDVSHLSDRGFTDLCQVVERPFVASHSNCRSLCPSDRNLTDEMIRAVAERGGVMGITLAPGFLSAEYHEKERVVNGRFFQEVLSGETTYDHAQAQGVRSMTAVPRPPLSTVVDHVKWAINKGGEDSVGLGGDLDGVDFLPAGFEGVADYPRIEDLLHAGGLTPQQIDKVCHQNFLRVFQEVLG